MKPMSISEKKVNTALKTKVWCL